jgi:hypothetical protein
MNKKERVLIIVKSKNTLGFFIALLFWGCNPNPQLSKNSENSAKKDKEPILEYPINKQINDLLRKKIWVVFKPGYKTTLSSFFDSVNNEGVLEFTAKFVFLHSSQKPHLFITYNLGGAHAPQQAHILQHVDSSTFSIFLSSTDWAMGEAEVEIYPSVFNRFFGGGLEHKICDEPQCIAVNQSFAPASVRYYLYGLETNIGCSNDNSSKEQINESIIKQLEKLKPLLNKSILNKNKFGVLVDKGERRALANNLFRYFWNVGDWNATRSLFSSTYKQSDKDKLWLDIKYTMQTEMKNYSVNAVLLD